MKKVLVIVGPTAVGKTAFSLQLAKMFQGEIISGDSIQVYQQFDLGSGKIKEEEKQGIPHYLIDTLLPTAKYSVADFQKEARLLIEQINKKDKLPMIVGGTGLYIKACLYDYQFSAENPLDPQLIQQLEQYDNETLYAMVKEKDPASLIKIHPNNRKRLIRVLVMAQANNQQKSAIIAQQKHEMLYDALIIGCTMEREKLYQRINQRVEQMFAEGLKEEILGLLAQGISFDHQAMQGIGYREWQQYIDHQAKETSVLAEIQKHSRQFAKRQYTWFNNQMPVTWCDMQDEESIKQTINIIRGWIQND